MRSCATYQKFWTYFRSELHTNDVCKAIGNNKQVNTSKDKGNMNFHTHMEWASLITIYPIYSELWPTWGHSRRNILKVLNSGTEPETTCLGRELLNHTAMPAPID